MHKQIAVLLLGTLLLPLHSRAFAQMKSTGNARYDAAVAKGVAFLKSNVKPGETSPEKMVLSAYAMFKAGEPPDSPIIKAALDIVDRSVRSDGFHPHVAYDQLYEAGLFTMFLADVDADKYQPLIQQIANFVINVQKPDGSWSEAQSRPGDVSMCQYAVLTLWAAQRAGCTVSPEALDRNAAWHISTQNSDGGWSYRPGTSEGAYPGVSTRSTTMASVSSLAVSRLMLYGPKNRERKAKDEEKKFGILVKNEEIILDSPGSFPGYRPRTSLSDITSRIDRALAYETARFNPVHSHSLFPIYFYYTIERALSVAEIDSIAGREWYPAYGDGLLSLQNQAGAWNEPRTGDIIGSSFAVLYYMRSTKQILDKQFGLGLLKGNRGNPFGDDKKEREPTSLDLLLKSMENIDFSDPNLTEDVDMASELVRSVQSIEDPEVLVGQIDRLKGLVQHPSAEVRQPVYWALGRTGEFSLVPLLLRGLRDPNVDVNVEAEMSLRYIARKPAGFGLPDDPLAGVKDASDEERLRAANQWRDKAFKAWSTWYFERRPFEDRDGIDELEALVPTAVPGKK